MKKLLDFKEQFRYYGFASPIRAELSGLMCNLGSNDILLPSLLS